MRFMVMHKNDPHTEAGEPPSMEIVTRMGAFIGDYVKSGKLVDGAGLGASKTRTRLRFRDGQCSVQHGPYAGESELPARMLFLEVRTKEQALAWAERYGKVLGDCDLELGKVNEPWDIGVMPAPVDPPLHFLLIEKADRVTESGGRSAQQKAAITRLETEMTKAGVLQRTRSLQPSTRAKRLTFRNDELSIVDGPFSESKELIGGFAVLDLADFDEVIAMSRPYAHILGGTLEMDIRVVADDDA